MQPNQPSNSTNKSKRASQNKHAEESMVLAIPSLPVVYDRHQADSEDHNPQQTGIRGGTLSSENQSLLLAESLHGVDGRGVCADDAGGSAGPSSIAGRGDLDTGISSLDGGISVSFVGDRLRARFDGACKTRNLLGADLTDGVEEGGLVRVALLLGSRGTHLGGFRTKFVGVHIVLDRGELLEDGFHSLLQFSGGLGGCGSDGVFGT
jgi:hypothetical protein